MRLVISGYTGADDALVHAQIILRAADSSETLLAETDGPPPSSTSLLRTWIDTTLCTPAAGQAGDALRLRVHFISGSTYFSSIITKLEIP
jgi:hypothetical protein